MLHQAMGWLPSSNPSMSGRMPCVRSICCMFALYLLGFHSLAPHSSLDTSPPLASCAQASCLPASLTGPCPECLSDIPHKARRCKFCCSAVEPLGGVKKKVSMSGEQGWAAGRGQLGRPGWLAPWQSLAAATPSCAEHQRHAAQPTQMHAYMHDMYGAEAPMSGNLSWPRMRSCNR